MTKKTEAIEFDPFLGGDDSNYDIEEALPETTKVEETDEAPALSNQPIEEIEEPAKLDDGVQDDDNDSQTKEPEPQTESENEEAGEEDRADVAEADGRESDEPHIPKSRLDREAARRRELEQSNQQLMAELQRFKQQMDANVNNKPDDFQLGEEVGKKANELFQAIGDENLDQASQIFNDILKETARTAADRALQNIDTKIEQGTTRHTTAMSVQETIESLKQQYPQLDDSNDDSFDQDAVDETLLYQRYYIDKGYNPANALRMAADRIVGQSTQVTAPTRATPKKRSVKETTDLANAQPPKTTGLTNTAPKAREVDLMTMPLDDFEKLTQAELAKLRGDYL